MEVAGLVLGVVGVLPVMVQIVRGYQIIDEASQARRYMAMLGWDLSTEEMILRQTYETLLSGIVPAWELEDLQNLEPSSAQWQRYDDQIRLRLRGSYAEFQRRVQDVAEAVQGLREKLPVNPDSEISAPSWPSKVSGLASEVRFRTRVTLKKRDCIDAVTRIRENNNVLRRLVAHSAAFESTRRANSQARFAKEVRTTAQGLFSSIRKVIRCQCVDSHRIGLHLRQKTGQNGDFKEGDVSFEMIFGTVNDQHKHSPRFELLNIRWKEKAESTRQTSTVEAAQALGSLSLKDKRDSPQKGRFLGTNLGQAFPKLRRSPSRSKSNYRQKVRFAEMVTTLPRDKSPIATVADSSVITRFAPPHITDLCADIRRGETMASRPVGFLACNEMPGGFNIYRHDTLLKLHQASVTLQEALSGEKPGLVEFELTERLNVALALSFNALQLCNTQWLGKAISLEGVVFLRAADADHCFSQSLENPSLFLIQQPSQDKLSEKPGKPINFALLSLGIILTHIINGRPIEAIDISEGMTKETLLSRRDIAFNKVEICDYASTNYVDAVQWCLQNCFTFKTLEDENLGREFHDAVIARLESDLRSIHELSIQ